MSTSYTIPRKSARQASGHFNPVHSEPESAERSSNPNIQNLPSTPEEVAGFSLDQFRSPEQIEYAMAALQERRRELEGAHITPSFIRRAGKEKFKGIYAGQSVENPDILNKMPTRPKRSVFNRLKSDLPESSEYNTVISPIRPTPKRQAGPATAQKESTRQKLGGEGSISQRGGRRSVLDRLGPHFENQPTRSQASALALMQLEIDNMKAQLEIGSNTRNKVTGLNEPLSIEIELAPVQTKIAPPRTPLYEGRSDPETHLSKFRIYMTGCGATNATKCRMFPLTLGDLAHRWYTSLPSRSVNSFEKLASDFRARFATKVARREGPQRMMRIRQGQHESDKDYIDRVEEIILSGDPISDELTLHSVLGGFHGRSPMFRHLTKDFPSTYAILRAKATDFLRRQRLLAPNLDEGATDRPDKAVAHSQTTAAMPPGNFKTFEDVEAGLFHRLNLSPTHILNAIEERGLLSKPRPIRDHDNLDRSKFCAYHKGAGHNTNQCRDLLRQIWRLLEEGKLNNLI